jgi:Fic family protein
MMLDTRTVRNAGPASLTLVPPEGHKAWGELRDLAYDLARDATALAQRLHPETVAAIGDLVRGMNCYYSNLIEGHDTRPVEIDRALKADFSADPEKRDLQLEAAAHIEVQAALDAGLHDTTERATEIATDIHRRFCERLPPDLLLVRDKETGRTHQVIPGALRDFAVTVGRHVPPLPEELPSWFTRLDDWKRAGTGRAERVVAIAALHHRFLWVHPFGDGNGHAARLLAHALFRQIGLGSPLWSVSRGLARQAERYKALLSDADAPPQGAQDGRGILSDGRLAAFCAFFLETCLDQVGFMRRLLEPEALILRLQEFVGAESAVGRLDRRVLPVLRQAVLLGSVPRRELPQLTGVAERQARRIVAPLVERGLLQGSKEEPLRIAFPLAESERVFPHLWRIPPAG